MKPTRTVHCFPQLVELTPAFLFKAYTDLRQLALVCQRLSLARRAFAILLALPATIRDAAQATFFLSSPATSHFSRSLPASPLPGLYPAARLLLALPSSHTPSQAENPPYTHTLSSPPPSRSCPRACAWQVLLSALAGHA
eukprot:6191993-Pleurochrysis_carterae.AAC.4